MKCIIKKEIHDQIQYVCQKHPKIEWAGIFFYKINKDKIEILKFMPQIYGNFGSVSTNEKIELKTVKFRNKNFKKEELKNIYTGRIHSHNNMNVFFSNTDKDHLNQLVSVNQPIFSIVTNNNSEYLGYLAYYVTPFYNIKKLIIEEIIPEIENNIKVSDEFKKLVDDMDIKKSNNYSKINFNIKTPESKRFENYEYYNYFDDNFNHEEFTDEDDILIELYDDYIDFLNDRFQQIEIDYNNFKYFHTPKILNEFLKENNKLKLKDKFYKLINSI